jgi:DNA-binding transcriptional regulator YiaG
MTLNEYMILKNYSYRDLSRLWGISHATLWNWRQGTVQPTEKNKRKIFRKTNGEVVL